MKLITSNPAHSTAEQPLTVGMMKYGQPFSYTSRINGVIIHGPLYIRVKPTGFLLNSDTIGDVISRGDILTFNLERNTLHYMKVDTPVVLREAHVVVED